MDGDLRYLPMSHGQIDTSGLSPRELEVLDEVNRRVAGAESLDGVMSFLFDRTRDVMPCDRIGLALVEEGERVASRWIRADYEPVLLAAGWAEDLRGSSLESLLREPRVRIIGDLEAYGAAHPDSRSTRALVREGVRSSLTCPLRAEGRTVGLLFRSSRRAGAYEDRHATLAAALAERLAQAVEKAWHIERLDAANRAYGEMLAFVAHELKAPVASMILDAQMLLDGYAGDVSPAQRDRLERSVRKGEHLLSLVREYLDLAKVEAGDLAACAREGVDLGREVIEPAVDVARPAAAAKGMTLEVALAPDPLVVSCDPDLMRIVAVNLVGNAVKYGRSGGAVRVRAARGDGAFELRVFNEGPGFDEAERGKLFRKFSRLAAPELRKEKGTGVGLYTVWRAVRAHGGRMDARSEPGSWAEFTATVPQG